MEPNRKFQKVRPKRSFTDDITEAVERSGLEAGEWENKVEWKTFLGQW